MKPCLVALAFFAVVSVTVAADERDDRIRALEKRVEQLEKLLQAQPAKTVAPPAETQKPVAAPKPAPTLSVGASGFTMRSADSNFVLRLRGVVQLDSRTFFDDGGISGNDGFVLRRVRPIFEGTVHRDFQFRIQSDFAGSAATIRDAYINYTYNPGLQLRLGKFKTPVGLSQIQSDSAGYFNERAMVSGLLPSRDLGVQLHGELWPGTEADTKALGWDGLVNYAFGVFNGLGDGRQSGSAEFDDAKHLAGRLFLHPFLRAKLEPLKGLGVGIGGSFGDTHGVAGLPSGSGFATEGQQSFFTYFTSSKAADPNVIADGSHWRISPQAYWHWKRFGLLGEYAISSQELRRTDLGTRATVRNTGWQITGAYVLTGETPNYKYIVPDHPFDPRNNSWGAFELVGRYSRLKVDDAAFPLFADPAQSAHRAAAWGVGLNWYLNRNIRTGLDFIHTDFRSGAAGEVSGQDENVFLTRVQVTF